MIEFTIPGNPVPWARPQFTRRGGTYTKAEQASHKNISQLLARSANKGHELITDPVIVELDFFIAIPKSWSEKKKKQARIWLIRPASKPDIDNFVKLILDSLNETVLKDDAQVVEIHARKLYDDMPRTNIRIIPIGGLQTGGSGV